MPGSLPSHFFSIIFNLLAHNTFQSLHGLFLLPSYAMWNCFRTIQEFIEILLVWAPNHMEHIFTPFPGQCTVHQDHTLYLIYLFLKEGSIQKPSLTPFLQGPGCRSFLILMLLAFCLSWWPLLRLLMWHKNGLIGEMETTGKHRTLKAQRILQAVCLTLKTNIHWSKWKTYSQFCRIKDQGSRIFSYVWILCHRAKMLNCSSEPSEYTFISLLLLL